MYLNNILFIGMDTHKEYTEIAYTLDGRDQQPNHLGKIKTNKQSIKRLEKEKASNLTLYV
jgi:transposase